MDRSPRPSRAYCGWTDEPLGAGETEAIRLARELALPLIIDDLAARHVARTLGVQITGTLGVLLTAKRRNLVERLGPLVDGLEREGFHMGPQLRQELLAAGGEAAVSPGG